MTWEPKDAIAVGALGLALWNTVRAEYWKRRELALRQSELNQKLLSDGRVRAMQLLDQHRHVLREFETKFEALKANRMRLTAVRWAKDQGLPRPAVEEAIFHLLARDSRRPHEARPTAIQICDEVFGEESSGT